MRQQSAELNTQLAGLTLQDALASQAQHYFQQQDDAALTALQQQLQQQLSGCQQQLQQYQQQQTALLAAQQQYAKVQTELQQLTQQLALDRQQYQQLQKDQQQLRPPAGPALCGHRNGEPLFGLRSAGRGRGRTGRPDRGDHPAQLLQWPVLPPVP